MAEALTVRIPRSALNERMHATLERNTEGTLGPVEKAELETLVQMSSDQYSQWSSALSRTRRSSLPGT